MYYHFKIHKEEDKYWAEGVELENCCTQGDTLEELMYNLKEVLNLYLDEPGDSKIVFPLPDENIKGKDIVKIKVDPQIAFSHYLRIKRLEAHMTQKEISKKLGFKHLWSYQRLESSKNNNPALKTLEKIKTIFPDFDLNLIV